MQILATLGSIALILVVLWDAFEAIILPRRVTMGQEPSHKDGKHDYACPNYRLQNWCRINQGRRDASYTFSKGEFGGQRVLVLITNIGQENHAADRADPDSNEVRAELQRERAGTPDADEAEQHHAGPLAYPDAIQ